MLRLPSVTQLGGGRCIFILIDAAALIRHKKPRLTSAGVFWFSTNAGNRYLISIIFLTSWNVAFADRAVRR